MAICAVDGETKGHASAVGQQAALGAYLPTVRGVLAPPFPPKGGFGHGTVHREPLPVNPLQGIIGYQALFPEGHKDVRLCPLLATTMSGTVRAEPSGIEGTPLATGAEDEEEGIHRLPIINAASVTPQGVWCAWGEQRLDTFP
jgi:hypothetical protein